MAGWYFIILSFLVAVFAYVIIPDNTPFLLFSKHSLALHRGLFQHLLLLEKLGMLHQKQLCWMKIHPGMW